MKKVLIYAYTNFNLGDDLFIKILCNRYPETNFIIHAPKIYKKSLKEIKNLSIISNNGYIYRSVNLLLRKTNKSLSLSNILSRKVDAIVYIGGSIYMQAGNWRQKMKRLERISLNKKPIFVLGANFGPYKNDEFYLGYKKIFKEYKDICFRDNYSFDLFKDIDNVRKADDVVFQLKNMNKSFNGKQNNIAISVIKPSIRKDLKQFDGIYYEKIRDIIIYFIDRDYSITLISFCTNEGDKEAINSIISIIPDRYLKKINKHFYEHDIESTLNVIEKSKFMVGTRFHAMILGWVYNIPVFPIAYSKKMINVLNDINFEGNYVDFENLQSLKPEEVFKSMFANQINIASQIKNSEKQFKKLDEYLI